MLTDFFASFKLLCLDQQINDLGQIISSTFKYFSRAHLGLLVYFFMHVI